MIAKRVSGRPSKDRDFAKEAAVASDYKEGKRVTDIIRMHNLGGTGNLYKILSDLGITKRSAPITNRDLGDESQGAA